VGHALSLRLAPGAALLASEPHDDDPGWQAVPDGRLVVATAAGARVDALPAG
ncbi:ergothioneine biosynthesis protein EgtC, partial [Micromonospora carbonacea]